MEPTVPYVRAKYYFFRGRLDDAAMVFSSIPATSPYYFQSRYFLATIQVKKGDLAGAITAYDDLLKQQAPDDAGKDIQDLARLAIARLYYERSQFDKAIESYLSIGRQSNYWSEALREQAWTYVKAKDWQRDLSYSEKVVQRIEHVMTGSGRVGIFPDLAAARSKSIEMTNQVVETREKFVGKIRAIIDPVLSADERKQLDRLAIERDGLERQSATLPTTDEAVQAQVSTMKGGYAELDQQVSELNVEIQSLEAQLVAVEQYYRVSRSEQKIRPEDMEGPVRDMRTTIEDLRAMHDKLREAIADASHDAATSGAADQAERETAAKLTEVLRKEVSIERAAAARLGGGDRAQVDRINDLLARCDAVDAQLTAFDKRVDGQVGVRIATISRYLSGAKEQLALASQKLSSVLDESKALGGGLAQAMFTRVAQKFYDLVVRSDVGIIDVSWGLKDQKTQAVTKLTSLKNLELKALDEDFRKVLEEDK